MVARPVLTATATPSTRPAPRLPVRIVCINGLDLDFSFTDGIPPCSTYNNDVGDLFHANVDAVITLWNRDLATTYGFLAPSIYPQSQYPIYLTGILAITMIRLILR